MFPILFMTGPKIRYSIYDHCGWHSCPKHKGCRMVPFNLKVLAKFGLCSNCSQTLDECSLGRARKIFATARTLGFSLKLPYMAKLSTLGKNARAMNASGNMHPFFPDVLLKLTHSTILLESQPQR